MKRISLIIAMVAIVTSLSAQQNKKNRDESLFERVSKIEKKSDKFNFYLNMNGSFDTEFNSDEFYGSKFNMRQLRIEAKGSINDWLSYRWRQRLNRPNISNTSIDNTPTSIDIAGIGIKLNDKLSLFAGKQCAAYGGIEFDLNPIEIYEYCDMIENMSNFMMGINFAYDVTPNHQIQFQVLNGLNHRFEETYKVDPTITASKIPLLYTLNWNGNLFNGLLNTRWSASVMSQSTDHSMYYFAFGNQVNLSKKFDFYFDAMYSNEGIDRKGIISSIINNGAKNATDVSYLSFLLKANYHVTPQWNVFVKGMYETASLAKDNANAQEGLYRTSFGYFAGVEYYPLNNSNLHFFLTYVGRSYNFDAIAKLDNFSTNRVSVGLIYQIPMY